MHKIGMGGAMAARNRNTILAGGGEASLPKIGQRMAFRGADSLETRVLAVTHS